LLICGAEAVEKHSFHSGNVARKFLLPEGVLILSLYVPASVHVAGEAKPDGIGFDVKQRCFYLFTFPYVFGFLFALLLCHSLIYIGDHFVLHLFKLLRQSVYLSLSCSQTDSESSLYPNDTSLYDFES